MAKSKVFDTQTLINHYGFGRARQFKPGGARAHAKELIELHGTNFILSPVLIEFLAGARTTQELELFKAYLEAFDVLDKGNIPRQDWEEAKRLAQRIGRSGRSRKLGDCLIQAIADRLSTDIISGDKDFKVRIPPR